MLTFRSISVVLLVLLGSTFFATPASAQCILANPSFELGGSGGLVFGGWNQFGDVGVVSVASHGSQAARASGPDIGDWDMSGFWQSQDCVPGQQWEITGHVQHPGDKPLTGECVALVNVQWWDAGGELIADESHTVADASTPTDEYQDFELLTGSAPTGTAAILILFSVLQSPTDPGPDVYYDQVTVFSTSSPTIDEVQWNDFPGGNTLSFGGYTWRVKGPGVYGPGPNYFCDSADCVWVDEDDRLHLTNKWRGNTWVSTEVVTEESLGYGDYILTTVGSLDQLDPIIILGIFLWEYGPCWDFSYTWWNAFNEIDIEYSRWGNPSSDLGQFVAQPYDYPGNISRFDVAFGAEEVASHAMRWLHDRVEYRVWRGGPDQESPETLVYSWTYTGPHISRPEQPRMHLNLWKLEGDPDADQEVIFTDFTFVPAGGVSAVGDQAERRIPFTPDGRLLAAVPNPFNPQTTVRFELTAPGYTELDVYDLNGRLVRTLMAEYLTAGEHAAVWDGRDDAGRRASSGVYLVRLRGKDFLEARRVALIK